MTEKTSHYPAVDANPEFSAIETRVLERWQREDTFRQSVDNRDGSKDYIFYDGPPFANGLPHYGHLLTGYVKDLFARYHTMKGERVERRFGWDCHGLPAEMGAEKELGVSGRANIERYGIQKFNDYCRTSVMKYTQEWEDYVTRQARWVDFENDYKTMDTPYMESVMWAFSELYKKGLVYESHRVMPYSWAMETPVSNFETRMDNSYREREDKAITVAFKLREKPKGAPEADEYFVLAWTTTPWTLPSNLALAVKADMEYTYLLQAGEGKKKSCYIVSSSNAQSYRGYFSDPVIRTDRLYARPFKESEYPLFKALETDPEIASRRATAIVEEEALEKEFARWQQDQKKSGYTQWALFRSEDNAFVGRAGFDHREWGQPKTPNREPLELRYALKSEYWGKGYASEITTALMDWALWNTNAAEIDAGTTFDNEPSHKILRKLGFSNTTQVNCNGKLVDYFLLDLNELRIARSPKGSDLIGLSYEPLFPYFALHDKPGAVVTTDRLYMRAFTEADYPLYRTLQSDLKVAATTSDGLLPEESIRKEFNRFLADQAKKGFSQWAVFRKEDDVFIGRAGFDNRDYDQFNATGKSCVELRYAYLSDFWGQGYASEAAAAVLSWGKRQKLAEVVIAGCNPTYDAAKNLLRKLGFTSYDCVPYKNQQVLYHDLPFDTWQIKPDISNRFRILDGSDFIEEGSGTGVVHMAPGFGEDDQRVCAANGIDLVVPVDERGCYTDAIFEHEGLALAGLNVVADTRKNADEPYTDKQLAQYGLANLRIITYLKGTGRLIKQEDYRHNYPHCWRTDTPLIYRALPSWYVEVSKFAPRMVELNESFEGKGINWIPDHIKHGRFGKWLEGARDWSISRNRYWGSPIPVWKNDKDDEIKVFGSIAELEAFFGVEVKDLHRPFIDELVKEENGKTWRRVTDVFDCWFESGSMPYAQVHYPFENKDWFETHFPADFIVEYEAQTRGWFYTLMVLSTALFDKPPFKNCICHGVVMSNEKDENGHYHKLSKRLRNYPDPMDVFGTYGADALRWFMMSSPVMRGSEMYIDKEGKFIRDSVRLYLKPIWNAYNFFTLYANADGVKAALRFDSENGMDRYILSKLAHAVRQVEASLDTYDTPGACQAVTVFFEDLNNWYIRRNKERFWKSEHDADKQAAYDTLYTVLHVMCRAISPLLPLISDEIYKGLTGEESVHLADFPTNDSNFTKLVEDQELMHTMDFVRDVCNAALAVRNKQNIRVRQPLKRLEILTTEVKNEPFVKGYGGITNFYTDIVAQEVNVHFIVESDSLNHYAELKTQVNLPVVGKKLGPAVKDVMNAARNGQWTKNADGSLTLAGVTLQPGEYTIMLEPKPEYKNSAQALSSNDALVILDLTVTPELEAEGIARDVVRMIQQSRKDADLDVSAHIDLTLELSPAHAEAVRTHAAYIREQVLASNLHIGSVGAAEHRFDNTLDEQKVVIAFSPVKIAA